MSYILEKNKLVDVTSIDKCLENIKSIVRYKDECIEELEKKNKELSDDMYKDTQLLSMKRQLDELREECRRGFPISESEEKAIIKWKKEHDEKVHGLKTDSDRMKAAGCIGGSLSYKFTPTSIGILGEAKCHCGAKFCFRELF